MAKKQRYKAISTITWTFESEESYRKALEHAKNQLDLVLDTSPQGEEYAGFSAHMNIVRLKDKNKLINVAEYGLEEVLPYISKEKETKKYRVDGKTYTVKMNSDRYFVFLKNIDCVACGLEGTVMRLELNPIDNIPHFNLYAKEDGRFILMTKDHIIPKSKNGKDILSNYETCCHICNNLKGNFDLTYDEVLELREINDNIDKLPRQELKDLINETREKMARHR